MNKKFKVKFQNKSYRVGYGDFAPPNIFFSTLMEWSFCSQPDNNGVVTQLSHSESCREAAISHLIHQISYKKVLKGGPRLQKEDKRKIYTNKLRILARINVNMRTAVEKKVSSKSRYVLYLNSSYDNKMLAGLKILNLYEKEYGWPLTKAYKLFVPCGGEKLRSGGEKLGNKCTLVYMFIGSSKWAISAPTISLFFLLIRCGKFFTSSKFSKCNNTAEFVKMFKSKVSIHSRGDLYYIATSVDYWPILFRYHREIFKNLKPSINFNINKVQKINEDIIKNVTDKNLRRYLSNLNSYSLYHDGISQLSTFRCKHIALNLQFHQACIKAKKWI